MKVYNQHLKKFAATAFALGSLFCVLSDQVTANPLPQLTGNTQAHELLQRMLSAQQKLSFSGTQVTTISRNGRDFSSQQNVTRDGNKGIRMEYTQPTKLKGQIIIDNGRVFWHYFPDARKLEVGPSRIHRLEGRIPQVLKQVERGVLSVQLTGEQTVAGRPCSVLQVERTGTTKGPMRRFWIDTETGAELGIEQYNAQGQRQSLSYYADVNYNPSIDQTTFAAPQVPPDVTTVASEISKPLSTVSEAQAQAGFGVIQPAYLPAGFRFQSASISSVGAKNIVGLRYVNGLNVLSLFETPAKNQPNGGKIRQPRPGVFIANRSGLRIILVGNMTAEEMNQILNSLPQ